MKKTYSYFDNTKDRVLMTFIYFVLFLIALCIIVPLLFILASSFSSPGAISRGEVYFWPAEFTLAGYKNMLSSPHVIRGFVNTVIYTVVGTLISVVVTVLCAYVLSRKALPGRNGLTFFFAFTMLFSGGMIPTFLVINQLKMIDTIWAMVLPGAMSVYNMIIVRTYMSSSIPEDLHESAALDGCSETRYLLSVVIPLSAPVIAVIVLLTAVGHWNSYFSALLYLRDTNKLPLQMILRSILIAGKNIPADDLGEIIQREYIKNLMQYAMIVISTIPILCFYPFIQKYFIRGIMIGAIKG